MRCRLALGLGGALATYSKGRKKMAGVSLRELAYFRLFNERLPSRTLMHIKIFEFMMKKGSHFTAEEVASETDVYEKFAKMILEELSEKRLIEKEGCLYRCNGIALEEILKYK